MCGQYSFSRLERAPETILDAAILAVDTGSPTVSVAVSIEARVVSEESAALDRSSSLLLSLIDRALRTAGLGPRDLAALVAVRGPGSFTGLRVGLATLQGMQQALQLPAATLSTFEVLASLADPDGSTITTCIDALGGQWLTQSFLAESPPRPLGEAKQSSVDEILATRASQIIGFGSSDLTRGKVERNSVAAVEPGPLAGQALRLLPTGLADWHVDTLANPLYLRPPAVSSPTRSARS